MHCPPRSGSNHRMSWSRLPNRRLYIGPRIPGGPRRRGGGTFMTMGSWGSKRAGERCRTASLSGGGGAFAVRNGAGAGDRPDKEGTVSLSKNVNLRVTHECYREPPERGKQGNHASGQPRTPRTRPEAASTTPGVTVATPCLLYTSPSPRD